MKIDEYLQTVLFCPVERLIEFFDASYERRAVAIDEIRNWDSDCIQSDTCDGREVTL